MQALIGLAGTAASLWLVVEYWTREPLLGFAGVILMCACLVSIWASLRSG